MLTLEMIEAARERIKNVTAYTPCPYSPSLSRLCGAEIYCKLDHLQATGSFKERGAANKLRLLSEETKARGVVCASAGNHAMGVSYHAKLLGIAATMIMPRFASLVKVENCRRYGANVVLQGDSFDDARSAAIEYARETGAEYITGFDDDAIMAGAGTTGLEIVEQVPAFDAVIVPVGGGGLLAGIGTVLAARRPGAKLIGVEPYNACSMYQSLQAGRVVRHYAGSTLADGLGVAEIGKLCFEVVRPLVDRVELVDEIEIARAVVRLLEHEKMVIEGAGAASLAAMMGHCPDLIGKKVVLLLCGGNIDITLLSRIIERSLATDGRLARITAHISEQPGSLARLLSVIAGCGASIKDVSQDRNFGPMDVSQVGVSIKMETRDAGHVAEIREAIAKAGISLVGETR